MVIQSEKNKTNILLFIGISITLIVIGVAAVIWNNMEAMKKTVIHNNTVSARKVADLAAGFIRLQDYSNLLNLLESLTQMPSIEYIEIVKNQKAILRSGKTAKVEKYAIRPWDRNSSVQVQMIADRFLVCHVLPPLQGKNNSNLKVLRIVYSLEEIEKRKEAVLLATLVIMVFLALLIVLLGMLNRISLKLKIAEKTKKHMIKAITHNANNNLNIIGARIEVLKGKLASKKGLASLPEDLVVMNENNQSIGYLIKNLNDHELLSKGEVEVSKTDTNIINRIAIIIKSLEESIRKKNITIQTTMPDQLFINTDIKLVEQIVMNLLINAIRYSGPDTTIQLKLEEEDDKIRVCIQDQGIGIASEDQEKVFEPFVRLVKEGPKGSGLGLSNSRNLARQMGGELGIQASAPGKGSTFYLELSKY